MQTTGSGQTLPPTGGTAGSMIGFERRPQIRLLLICGVVGLVMAVAASVVAAVQYVQAAPLPAVEVSMCQVLPASDVGRVFGVTTVGSRDDPSFGSCTYTYGSRVAPIVVDIGMTGQPVSPMSPWTELQSVIDQQVAGDQIYSVDEFGDAAVYTVSPVAGYQRTSFFGIVRKGHRDWLITVNGLIADSLETKNEYVEIARILSDRVVR